MQNKTFTGDLSSVNEQLSKFAKQNGIEPEKVKNLISNEKDILKLIENSNTQFFNQHWENADEIHKNNIKTFINSIKEKQQ